MRRTPRSISVAFVLVGTACARYAPAPLDPVAVADRLQARRLDAPALQRYLAEHGSGAPDGGWTEDDLALAAMYYHPALDQARAHWRAARAGERTAGARPRPDAEGEVGYGVWGSDAFESPWVAALGAVFRLELGGKRGARIAMARARAAGAEVELEAAAWRITQGVRGAARELAAVEGRAADAGARRAAAAALAQALDARYARGEINRAQLAAVEAEAAEARAVEAERAAQRAVARGALAKAMGMTPAALDGVAFRLDGGTDCAALEGADSLRAVALRNRTEVGRALAGYAVAEADLRLAVAGSYPDLALGPGFAWDQGVGRWSLLFGLPNLPLDGNRGPIAEALERREAAAAGVSVAEQEVLSDVTTALARCAAARAEVAAADSIAAGAAGRMGEARRAYGRGEIGGADTLAALVPEVRARAAAADARRRRSAAALALDAAVGAALRGEPRHPDPRAAPRGREETR